MCNLSDLMRDTPGISTFLRLINTSRTGHASNAARLPRYHPNSSHRRGLCTARDGRRISYSWRLVDSEPTLHLPYPGRDHGKIGRRGKEINSTPPHPWAPVLPPSWHKLFLLAPVGRNGSDDTRVLADLVGKDLSPTLSYRLLGYLPRYTVLDERVIPRYGGWTAR
ncbi:hypothetical protein LY76DRAFT_35753 [Colletotrichum caudatum]|nr:hypothetical protein LY76DRAFT_35753 [Colletotrichum caudatum]